MKSTRPLVAQAFRPAKTAAPSSPEGLRYGRLLVIMCAAAGTVILRRSQGDIDAATCIRFRTDRCRRVRDCGLCASVGADSATRHGAACRRSVRPDLFPRTIRLAAQEAGR